MGDVSISQAPGSSGTWFIDVATLTVSKSAANGSALPETATWSLAERHVICKGHLNPPLHPSYRPVCEDSFFTHISQSYKSRLAECRSGWGNLVVLDEARC